MFDIYINTSLIYLNSDKAYLFNFSGNYQI